MRAAILLALAAAGSAFGADLFRDDFSRYPPGPLSTPVGELNAAIQEYHYLAHRGVPLGPWANAISHLDAWVAGGEDGKPYLEQHLTADARQFAFPIFLTGDSDWSSYTVETRVKPLALNGMTGVVFRYHTNRHYYLFALTGGNQARLALHLPLESALRVRQWKELGAAPFAYDTTRYYALRVENDGPRIRAYVDGNLILEAQDSEIARGKAGVIAGVPARFQDFAVTASDAVKADIQKRIAARDAELEKLRASNPRPKLWKKFETPRFGAGRNVRFGDLDGDAVPEMLIAQNVPRVRGDAFDAISCLTAVTLDGKVLWQSGRPDPRNGLLTNDTPFQIHDIDGDGRNEVVLVRDFKLQILDGATGKVKRAVPMPKAPESKERPYELVSGDSIVFLNLSGNKDRREILVKDRYEHFWVFSNKLELLWQGEEQTGHYPFPFEGASGRDQVAIGYSLWNHDGKRLWSQGSVLKDHADGVMIGNLSGNPNAPPRMYASGSDEGFIVFDMDGKILKHVRVGHNQSPSVGKYRPDLPGLQYMSVNFWKNPGIITLFDWDGNILVQDEPIHTGSPMLPVNWRGDGQEFVLLSGNLQEGGMIDGHLRRVVMFPDDGHPDLAANVLDLTGDQRDEIVLWDQSRVWIYTQDRPFDGQRIYAPRRNPDYNESNYRTNVSLPNWEGSRVRTSAAAASPALPGKGLAQYPFLYCGEWQQRGKSDQAIYVVRGGKVVWTYAIPGREELGDCTMLSNGNILFSRRLGASEITPDKKIVWNYEGPPKTEIHTSYPMGNDRVLVMQNGNPAKLLVMHKASGRIDKEMVLQTRVPDGIHGQFRHVRPTKAGTFLVAHMDLGKVVEYDGEGKQIWSVPAPSAWAAVRLKNGNTLIRGNQRGYVREVNPKGETVWEINKDDLPGIPLYTVQEATRLANGNTLINNWAGSLPLEQWPSVVQLIEVSPDKKVVWALRDWNTVEPASSTQLLDEPGVPENGDLQR